MTDSALAIQDSIKGRSERSKSHGILEAIQNALRWQIAADSTVGPVGEPGCEAVPAVTNLTFAHRYLASGDIEFICMACLDVVCTVQQEWDAMAYKESHNCLGEEQMRRSSPGER